MELNWPNQVVRGVKSGARVHPAVVRGHLQALRAMVVAGDRERTHAIAAGFRLRRRVKSPTDVGRAGVRGHVQQGKQRLLEPFVVGLYFRRSQFVFFWHSGN